MNIKLKKYKIISLILMYCVYMNVFLMGDDFLFASYHLNGLKQLIFHVLNYGMNGRLIINLLESLVLYFDRYLYIFIMPIVVLFIIKMIVQLCNNINNTTVEKSESVEWLFCIFFFAVLSIDIKRETFYWISGSFNYLYPVILILVYSNIYYKIRRQKKVPLFLPIVGFLLGASSEQISLMACGIFGCTYVYQIIYKKQRIYLIEIISYILLIMGMLSLFLATGTMNRIGTEKEKIGFVQNIFTLIYNCSYSKVSVGIISATVFIEIFLLKKYIKKWYRFLYAVSIISIISLVISQFIGTIPKGILLGNTFAILILLVDSFLLFRYKWKESLDLTEILWLLAGAGSQIMLLATDVWGFRTTFPWIITFLIILIANINSVSIKYQAIAACLLMAGINITLSLVGIILIILMEKKVARYRLHIVILISGIALGFATDAIGYHSNQKVHLHNINKIKSYQTGKLYLEKLENERYSWIGYDEFHIKAMLEYYQKDKDVKVIYQ